MKSLKIGYVSDTHIDFYINSKEDKVSKYIDRILKPQGGDVLVVAGDISHYNSQIKKFLKTMTSFYNHVIFTIGNHDLYLISGGQRKKYKNDSFMRLSELKEWSLNETNIHLLDGNSITIDGITFGGLPNWYDCPHERDIHLWNSVMNDSNLIYEGGKNHYVINLAYGYREAKSTFDTQAFRKKQEENFEKLKDIDILVTHICPNIIPSEYMGDHTSPRSDMFYMTDDLERVKKTGAKYVIYGHNHTEVEWEDDKIHFLSNSIGYPSEHKGNSIKYFKFTKRED